ncbi:hypothetical protein PN462_01780 [Spirulina sp. CS-785/01]|uniref:hypothetical protein n=1 Tax=Spirulina sp. CS-785/01 TaxID=3021716 RepID=UPI00232AC571|nr:hypothetical protein [Spirulina sp. CS-785/01]MDB9311814.1 hypothetical protein [Spirulina sp. CS-785/01]
MNVIQYNPGHTQGVFLGVINNIGLVENFTNAGFLQLCRVRHNGDAINQINAINDLLGWNNNPIQGFKVQSFNLNQQGWFIDHLCQPPDQQAADYNPFIQITTLPLQPQLPDLECLAVYSNNGQIVENGELVRVANNHLQRPMLFDQPANHEIDIILEFMVILVYSINQQYFFHDYRFYWSWNIATGANFQGFNFPFVGELPQLNQMMNVLQED